MNYPPEPWLLGPIASGSCEILLRQISGACPSLQFSSVVSNFCNPMDCSTPGFPVPHQLLEFAQTYVHWVDDAIQPSHPLPPSSPFALNLSRWAPKRARPPSPQTAPRPGGGIPSRRQAAFRVACQHRCFCLSVVQSPRWAPSAFCC